MTPDFINACRGGEAVAECFAAPRLLHQMLAFEVALADAEARLGIIPTEAARIIARTARVEGFDLQAIALATRESATPVIPFVRAFTALVLAKDLEAARYVHFGSTSQDVLDTALMLAGRDAMGLLLIDVKKVMRQLMALADRHRVSLIPARSLSQHAGPTTLGLKFASCLDGFSAALEACAGLHWPLQFGGATGTQASFGGQGAALAILMAQSLKLQAVSPWHTERSMVRSLAAALAQVAAASGKLANDFILLAQTEVGELSESAAPGRGGSSALPHKQNPVAAIAAVAAARRAPALLASVFGAFDHEHERAAGAWHVEMPALVELFTLAAGTVENLHCALDGVNVDIEAMRRNFDLTQGLSLSEAVSVALAKVVGRSAAQALVNRACQAVRAGQGTLAEVLITDPRITEALSIEGFSRLLDPHNFLGSNEALIDAAIERAAALLRA